MIPRPDVRLDDTPMQEVTCTTCSAAVLARKSSWEQTSIQWSDESSRTCVERRASPSRSGPSGDTFAGCSSLRASIREAAVTGSLQVVSGEPVPTNPDAPDEEHG